MSGMFTNCYSLISSPDISIWNINNSKYMSRMFSECSSLAYLPDISKWTNNNVNDISKNFNRCLNNISKKHQN